MPVKAMDQKIVDPEAELINAQRMFRQLVPRCSVKKRAHGEPLLAPQEKQLSILKNELNETLLCIKLATRGQHALTDRLNKVDTQRSIVDYENLETTLRDEQAQQGELDVLNYLAKKQVQELAKQVPSPAEELELIDRANNSLRRMENRLDLATKRFCSVNTENKELRNEIQFLLVERYHFNEVWNRTIAKLMKGKEYLMDIFEIANNAFASRDEICRKLEALKWSGLFQLNKDIAEMQSHECELIHLAKLEEFLRVKGSRRVCEAEDMEEIKRLEEMQRCEKEIKHYDALWAEILKYAGSEKTREVIENFRIKEIENFSVFILLCEVLQESVILRRQVDRMRQTILDQHDMNEARSEREARTLAGLSRRGAELRARNHQLADTNHAADLTINNVLKGIDDLVRLAKCDITPLLALLGNNKEVQRYNVHRFLKVLECEVKSLVEVAYGAVKPPAPIPTTKKGAMPSFLGRKMVCDPVVTPLIPNRINQLVPYQPCAFCVEDYIMHLVFETPAVPADREYIEEVFHLEDVNTKFGIFTLTVPAKRHPFRTAKNNT